MDDTKLVDTTGIYSYQFLIGGTQWAISLRHLDVNGDLMTMSSFCAAPRCKHWNLVNCMYRYLSHMWSPIICFHTREPNYSSLAVQDFD